MVADKKKKRKSSNLDMIWTRTIRFEGTVIIYLTTKDRLTENFTDYLPEQISICKIFDESSLSQLRIDFKVISFLLKSGNRHFPQ